MKCPKCKGCGMMDVDDGIFAIHGYDCDYCLGTGYIEPMTNEEYIRSCSTEQLAETIAQYFYGWTTNSTPYDIILHSVVEWLKQPHSFE